MCRFDHGCLCVLVVHHHHRPLANGLAVTLLCKKRKSDGHPAEFELIPAPDGRTARLVCAVSMSMADCFINSTEKNDDDRLHKANFTPVLFHCL